MLLEKMFGNAFGLICLMLFVVIVFTLIVFMLVKKDDVSIVDKEEKNENSIEENVSEINETVKKDCVEKEEKEDSYVSEYEIIEGNDGFFRVRKIGTERTVRKFETKEEAQTFIKQKESK